MSGFAQSATGGFPELTYTGALEKIKRAKHPYGTVSANLTVHQREGYVGVVLHKTEIAQLYPDKSVKLFSGGWRTLTTKRWIEEVLQANYHQSYGIWTVKGAWILSRYTWLPDTEGSTRKQWSFYDGITLGPRGGVRSSGSKRKISADIKAKSALAQDVKDYAASYVKHFFAGKVPAPSSGDCMFCAFSTKDGKTLGELQGAAAEHAHILEHVRAAYYVPTLLLQALRAQGLLPDNRPSIINDMLLVMWYGAPTDLRHIQAFVAGAMYSALAQFVARKLGLDIRTTRRDRPDLVDTNPAPKTYARKVRLDD